MVKTGRKNIRILKPGEAYEKTFVVPLEESVQSRPAEYVEDPMTTTTTWSSKGSRNSSTRSESPRNSRTSSSRSSGNNVGDRGAGDPGPHGPCTIHHNNTRSSIMLESQRGAEQETQQGLQQRPGFP